MTQETFEPLAFQEKPVDEMIAASRAFDAEMRRRHSVREFSSHPIPMEVIENAIRAAGSAPSGANMQPWHFAVVTSAEKKRQIRAAAEREERAFYEKRASAEWLDALAPLNTNASKPFLETAPCLIAIFYKSTTLTGQGKTRKNYYPKESVGIATGILITALHLAGLVTLTYTPSPMNFLNDLLQRPKNEHPFLLLVTGYPAENAQVPQLEKYPLEKIATFE
ncbi:nitroreductase [Ornatilinea apprima]|uniref:Nitroreductase n=2 Tax=Ornatilinea apprima TaxID=1134406 RepID=A0A0P6XP90_9CHLR|nr:nitroreductase [Ornatilinea apprima]